MTVFRNCLIAIASAALALSPAVVAAQAAGSARASSPALPLVFEQNQGQFAPEVRFLGQAAGYTAVAERDELRLLTAAGGDLHVRLGAGGQVEGVTRSTTVTNRVDVARSRTGIANFSRIRFAGQQAGVESEFYSRDGEVEHDFHLAAGTDAAAVRMQLSGGTPELQSNGEVSVAMAGGAFVFHKPVAYQVAADGSRQAVAASFRLKGSELGFELGAYDHSRELVIDPVIAFATFVGGANGSTASTVATDASGNVYLSGTTTAAPFATTAGSNVCPSTCGTYLFTAKFAAGSDGTAPAWITYTGLSETGSFTLNTALTASAVSSSTVVVAGYTNASTLPTAGGGTVSNTFGTGGYVGFYEGLNASSGALTGTAILAADRSNPNNNAVTGAAFDAAGDLWISGYTGAGQTGTLSLTPTSNAYAVTPAVTAYSSSNNLTAGNAFAAKYAAAALFGSPAFFTYLQTGTLTSGIAVDALGGVYVAGYKTGGFATVATKSNTSGSTDAFLLHFTPGVAGPPVTNGLSWLDGNGASSAVAVALDGAGSAYLFGNTKATNLGTATGGTCATATAQCSMPDVTSSGFVAKVSSTGGFTDYTYLGGSGGSDTVSFGAYASGTVYAAGQTNSPGTTAAASFAGTLVTQTTSAPFNQKALASGQDKTTLGRARGYLVALDAALANVKFVANIGGNGGADRAVAVATDSAGAAYVAATGATTDNAYLPLNSFAGAKNTSAYLAKVVDATTASGLALTVSGTPTATAYYQAASGYPLTYSWTLGATSASAATGVVVSIPASSLLTFGAVTLTDTTTGGSTGGSCELGTAGASCLIPTMPQAVPGTNDRLEVSVTARVPASTTNGTATLTATAVDAASEYTSSAQSTNVVATKTVNVVIGTQSVTYDGKPHGVTAVTSPTGLMLTYTYGGSTTMPTAVGSYPVVATVTSPGYVGTGTGTLVIQKATPVITFTAGSLTYGQTLASVLNATVTLNGTTVPGTYTYMLGSAVATAATVPSAGAYPISVTFVPTDSADINGTGTYATLHVAKADPVLSNVMVSSTNVWVRSAVTLTATVAGPSGAAAPAGAIQFLVSGSPLMTVTPTGGVSSYMTSGLPVGTQSITARYTGDNNYNAITSAAATVVSVDDFTVTFASADLSAASGQTTSFPVTVTALPTGAVFPGPITLAVSGLTAPTTFGITPSTIAAGQGTTVASLTVNANKTALFGSVVRDTGGVMLALMAPLLWRRKRLPRAVYVALALLFSVGLAAGVSSCGSGINFVTVPINVTGSNGATLQHTATAELTVK